MDGGRKVTMDEVLKLGAHPALKCGPWISWSINGENNQVCLLYVIFYQSSQISVIQPALFDSLYLIVRFCYYEMERHTQKWMAHCMAEGKDLHQTLHFLNKAGLTTDTAQ
jgi:hypothetical protein